MEGNRLASGGSGREDSTGRRSGTRTADGEKWRVAAVPAYNEERTIGSIVLLAKSFVDEVVVVDDGSRDSTAEIAASAGAVVIQHERNAGKGRALVSAFQWARDHGVTRLVLLDGDGQHDPREIPKVLEPLDSGEVDMVLGVRFGEQTNMPKWRRAGKRALDYGTAVGSGVLTDSQTGFRALGENAIAKIRLEEKGFGVESEMIAQAHDAGLRFAEVPVHCEYGNVKGSTLGPFQHALNVLGSLVRNIGEKHPLLVLGMPASVLFIAGILMSLRVLQIVQDRGKVATGSAVAGSLMTLAGLMIGLVAIILHVLPGAIAKQVRRHQESFPAVREWEKE